MKRNRLRRALLILCLSSLAPALISGCRREGEQIVFAGGPGGGTFHVFAMAMAEVMEQGFENVHVSVQRSGGSLANLAAVDRGEARMALVYAGDAYLGRKGLLDKGGRPTDNVYALARLYGARAQLVVLKNSPVRTPYDLKGKRVDIGSHGSGAALSAERYFRALGIWHQIIPVYVGYSMAMDDLGKGAVSAVWEMVGIPSPSLRAMSSGTPVRLLDLEDAAREKGLFEAYPFYTPAIIPEGTYQGQGMDVRTFQDSTLWVASPGLGEELVYQSLKRLFSAEGLAHMRKAHPSGRDLDAARGLEGVEIPLHPGAERFWRERGMAP